MKKFKIFVDMDKEEKYLIDMAKKGHILKRYSDFGTFYFEDGEPQDLQYRVDFRIFNKESDFLNYITLFEDAGWRHVCGKRYSGSQYFLPMSDQASNDIFSDKESKANRYNRIRKFCMQSISLTIAYFIIILSGVSFNLSELFFRTPGIWEMEGTKFREAFWFEFPFVLIRSIPAIMLIILVVICVVWSYKAKRIYEESMNE